MGEITIRNNSFIQSMHNDIQCIESLDPNDKGTSRQYWFTASMLANIFDISKDTVRNNVNFLIKWSEVTVAKNLATVQISSSSGAVNDTTLYDLQVFNKLAMQLRTDAAMEIRSKFSDILVQVETTGQYNTQPAVPHTYLEALKALVASEEEKEQLKFENKTLTQELDNAIKTKAYINDKRTASLMGKVSGQSKKITRLEGELTTANDNINNLQNELDRTLSNMYTTKQVCEIIRRKFTIKLADSTLNQRVGKALRLISNELNERVVPQYTVVGEVTRTRYFYTDLTAETLIERLENDNNYLKSVK